LNATPKEAETVMKRTLVVLAALVASPLAALAQKPVSRGEMVELTAAIDAIDHDSRLVTLMDKDGDAETIYCGPEVKRFDELKVGDTVKLRYYDSLVYMIRKPGQPSGLPEATGKLSVVPGGGARPGGTVSRQLAATVTVKAIDPSVPSVSVLTEDNRRATFKVRDRKNIEGLKAGDKVEIAYTQAVMISVE
jgi:Cu/Ag efflux protein CusF